MELKKGQKLYQIVFWNGNKRKLEYILIKKINPKTVRIAWYDNWLLKKDKIGIEWFLTKEEAIKNTIKLHQEGIKINHSKEGFREDAYKKSIKSLKNWLNRLPLHTQPQGGNGIPPNLKRSGILPKDI